MRSSNQYQASSIARLRANLLPSSPALKRVASTRGLGVNLLQRLYPPANQRSGIQHPRNALGVGLTGYWLLATGHWNAKTLRDPNRRRSKPLRFIRRGQLRVFNQTKE
jgi:hypothetical protein